MLRRKSLHVGGRRVSIRRRVYFAGVAYAAVVRAGVIVLLPTLLTVLMEMRAKLDGGQKLPVRVLPRRQVGSREFILLKCSCGQQGFGSKFTYILQK